MTWECHVDDSAKSRYNMILVTYLLTILVLILNFYKHIIEGGDGRFEGSTAPVIDLGMY